MTVLRGIGYALAALLALAAVMVGWALWAWRDIPVAELEARYGGPDLRTATVDGVPFRYRLEGAGPGRPVVVLIHSHFLDMRMWDPWMPVLLPEFAVLRYDLPAHGLTGPDPSGRYSVARDADLLDGLLRHAGRSARARW
jgi:alpha-beta hydrolase superfamily lysophospholipase